MKEIYIAAAQKVLNNWDGSEAAIAALIHMGCGAGEAISIVRDIQKKQEKPSWDMLAKI